MQQQNAALQAENAASPTGGPSGPGVVPIVQPVVVPVPVPVAVGASGGPYYSGPGAPSARTPRNLPGGASAAALLAPQPRRFSPL